MSQLQLDIVALDRKVFSEAIDSAIVPSFEGWLGILPGHAPLMAELRVGNIIFKQEKQLKTARIQGGVIKVRDNRILVATPAADMVK